MADHRRDENKDMALNRNTADATATAPSKHGRMRTGALSAVLALVLFGLIAGSASATTGHALDGTFGVPASLDPGGFTTGGPAGVAVRQSNGDVYAADPGHTDPNGLPLPRIERFDAAGVFQSEFAIDPAAYYQPNAVAIDPAGPSVYVGSQDLVTGDGVVLKYSTAGVFDSVISAAPGTKLSSGAVAVDPTDGTLYVGATNPDTGQWFIEVFDNTGTLQTTFDGASNSPDGGFLSISSLAVDSGGRIYVADNGKNRVDRYSALGAFQTTVDDGSRGAPVTVTADPVSDEIYVLTTSQTISWFTAGGAARQETFGAGDLVTGTGLAVNAATGTVYAGDAGQNLGKLFVEFVGPTVTTTSASAITTSDATLNGTIDPEGIAAEYHFDYGLDASYGTSTASTPAGSGNTAVPVSDAATGLLPNTQYHFRIVGANAGGAISGADQTFTTAPAPPTLDGEPANATAIRSDGATLNGTINPNGSDTAYHFDYGTTTAYGSTAPTLDAQTGPGQGNTAAGPVELTGLTPGTTYHFRLAADNGTGGVQHGADQTFTTAPGTPAGATSVSGITADLSGVVNPHGSAATYHFDYGLDTNYGQTTPETDAGSGNGEETVAAAIAGLKPGTTYHVRLVATDTATGVTTTGVDGTFTTHPAPDATTGTVTGVTTDRASFSGTIDTHGLAGSYRFYVDSSTSTYLGRTEPQDIPIGTTLQTITGSLTDLPPGQTYTVRLAATSSGVTTVGDTVTFSTAPLPPIGPPAPSTTVENPYGCAAPALAAYDRRPKPGDTITIAGTDLGVGGTVALGNQLIQPTTWSTTGFSIEVPAVATGGALPLTINCGQTSNTIAIQIYNAPSNSFTAKGKAKSSTATLSVKVPGPGTITVTGHGVKKATKHASKAGANSVKVTLSTAGKRSLKRHKKLSITLTVRFTPAGGTSASKTLRVTFKR